MDSINIVQVLFQEICNRCGDGELQGSGTLDEQTFGVRWMRLGGPESHFLGEVVFKRYMERITNRLSGIQSGLSLLHRGRAAFSKRRVFSVIFSREGGLAIEYLNPPPSAVPLADHIAARAAKILQAPEVIIA